jgi:hypothetical protein
MGLPSYMRSVVDRNVVMRHIPILYGVPGCRRKPPAHHVPNPPYITWRDWQSTRKEGTDLVHFPLEVISTHQNFAIYYFIYVEFWLLIRSPFLFSHWSLGSLHLCCPLGSASTRPVTILSITSELYATSSLVYFVFNHHFLIQSNLSYLIHW